MKIIDKSVLTFDKNNEPVAKAEPGEVLKFCPMDCFSNQVLDENTTIDKIDINECNPAAGPVYIEGAEPGDVLAVDILNIDVAEQGATVIFPGVGPIVDSCELRTKIIPVKDGVATFNDVQWQVNPMIGVIGTCPAGEPIPCGHLFELGGNMDSHVITKGCTVYLPVEVEGGLLQMGDLHASMGDGEITGTGIEIPGEIIVKTRLIKQFELNWPAVEDKDFWYVNTYNVDLGQGIRDGLTEMQRLVSNAYGWDVTDTALYFTLQADVQINQSCLDGELGNSLRIAVPKVNNKPPLIK
ncbi:MAG: acetamidase/formamidase family protein [Firmicutes bacterium]|nr:acetamidase/formamidase family protein [Bacillota bacterium]